VDLNSALKSGGRSTQGDGGFSFSKHRLRSLLVVSELAFSLMLLIGAGLLIRSFVRLQQVSPGFNPEHVISMRLGNSGHHFENRDAAVQYFRQLGDKIAGVPGVQAEGMVSSLPFTSSVGWGSINVEGFTPQPGQELQVDLRNATSDYFHTMEIPLVKGRFFSDHDGDSNAQPVVLIDEKFAQRFWPHEDPIGKHVWFDPKKKSTIVGVVGIVKEYGLDVDGRMVVYNQPGFGGEYMVARTASDPTAAAGAIVREIQAFDPSRPVYDIRTMQDRMSDSLARQRFSAIMLGAFAVFALILAAIGVYGVMSYLVTQSRHDIGLRIALGAQRSSILWLVVRQGMELAGAGIVAGIIGALALTRVMASLLFGVSAVDFATFSAVPLILAAIALLATYVPAWRATQVDPMMVLREE
jgi:predicted permease